MNEENKNEKDEGEKLEKDERISRRGFLAGSVGFAAGLAAGYTGVNEFLPPQKVDEVIIEGEITEKYVCPYTGSGFDSFEELKQNIVEEGLGNPVRMPTIKEVDEPHYEEMIVEDLERFEQNNIAFAREAWDEEFKERIEDVEGPDLEKLEIAEYEAADSAGWFSHRKVGDELYDWRDGVSDEKIEVEDRSKMTEKVKEAAKFFGADIVGVTKLDPRWIYSRFDLEGEPAPESETNISYDYVIALAMKMNWEGMRESPDWRASAVATGKGYSDMVEVSSKLAKYIRGLGYPAVPSGNDTILNVPVSVDAGLGEVGRHGLLITPKYGSNVRLAQVLTDLPLETDNPIDFGIQDYCSRCKQCARKCPVDAIPFEEKSEETPGGISNLEGMERWTVDTPSCLVFWRENGWSCANCIEACPWTRPRFKRDMYGAEV